MGERHPTHTWHDGDAYPATVLPDLDQLSLHTLHGHLYVLGFLKQGRALCVYWVAGLTSPLQRLTCLRLPERGHPPQVTMSLGCVADGGRLWLIGLSRADSAASRPSVRVSLQCGAVTPPNEAAEFSTGSIDWTEPVAGPAVGPHSDLLFSSTPWHGRLVLWTGDALHCFSPDLQQWRSYHCGGPDLPVFSFLGCAGDCLFACGRGTWFLCSICAPHAVNEAASVRCLPVEPHGRRPTSRSTSIVSSGRFIYLLTEQIHQIDSDDWHCTQVPPCKHGGCSQALHHKVDSAVVCGGTVFAAYYNEAYAERGLTYAALPQPPWAPPLLSRCPAAFRDMVWAFCRVALRLRLMPELTLAVFPYLPWAFHDGWHISRSM
eukprot:GGOE01044846.1.p1 GENE.GGOE01044846.1~~GGOE01044846.1.p1  ORF type:complete len:375 (-),score=44.39 GGOE01044846.1:209-1333(-)